MTPPPPSPMLHCIVSDCTRIARIGTERFLPHQGKIGINSCSTIIHYHHYSPRPLRPIQDIQENPVYIFMLNFFPHSPPPSKKNCPKSHSLGPKNYESPAYIFKSKFKVTHSKKDKHGTSKIVGEVVPLKP